MQHARTHTSGTLKPYYLLWGYRKCGTTSLAHQMRASGVTMPNWDESNIWLAREDDLPSHFEALWKDQLDAAYLVDLSTLTHLSRTPPSEVLATYGFQPEYIICTRDVGARWLSAHAHMARKRADARTLKSYLSFYEQFLGLDRTDLRQLEDELIRRDLKRGLKARHGAIDQGYFQKAYPLSFSADASDPHYQFRYFGEALDMLEKRPANYTTLALENPAATEKWISDSFGLAAVATCPMNRGSAFNQLRYHPKIARLTQKIPRHIRQPAAQWIERSRLLSQIPVGSRDEGIARALRTLVSEMIASEPVQKPEVAYAS